VRNGTAAPIVSLANHSRSSRIIPVREAWNHKVRGEGILDQRVRLNEAWYKVLKRLYPDGYPPKEEVSNVDLLDAFDKEYDRFKATERRSSRHPKPSAPTVLRLVGRRKS
jgi:hypothetical protein